MEPTPTPPNAPTPHAGHALVEFVRTQRANAGFFLVVVGIVFLALAVFFALRAFRAPVGNDKPADKPAVTDPFDPSKPPELPKAAGELANLKRRDYNVGWVACLAAFLSAAGVGAWLIASPPPADETRQRAEARVALLVAGGLVGAAAVLAGLLLFYSWSGSLTDWLDKGQVREARWVLYPLLLIVAGGGLVFLAIQPARGEERNNPSIRRTVYGANFALTALLLVVVFVVANVLFALKVPNKLDATSTGFYSLAEPTKQLLSRLAQPVNAYALLPEGGGREANDIRQLLLAAQDASDGKFKVKFLNQVADKTQLNDLRTKYPQLDLALSQRNVEGAVVLTTGDDEKRHKVISDADFFTRDRPPQFQGEVQLFRELMALGDTEGKPVVYFTQGNGELSIDPADEAPDDRKATRLRDYLEKRYLEARPLKLALENPTVPDDAAVVVVAGPRTPLPPAAAEALKKYATDPAKRGRLVVLAGAVPGPDGRGMMKTGLEDALKELNVRLGERFVYSFPRNPPVTLAAFSSRNEISLAIGRAVQYLSLEVPREVTQTPGGNPAFRPTTLLVAAQPTWVEENRVANLGAALQELLQNEQIARAKDLSDAPRPLAVIVSEGETPRAAVYGNAYFVSDRIGKQSPAESAPITFDLIGVTIDWLRGRPSVAAVGIEAKKYAEYTFPPPASVDTTRLLYLPLGLAFLVILGLGAGVWAIRRK